jgi:RNA polymerase sigma factor (sigma-70 family)
MSHFSPLRRFNQPAPRIDREQVIAKKPDEIVLLVQRARQGDQDAAHDIVTRYSPSILQIVRRHIAERVRTLVDSTDLLQDVWAAFFGKSIHQRTFGRGESLIHFLVVLAKHKVIELNRRLLDTASYNLRRERSLAARSLAEKAKLIAHDPPPERVAIALEEYQHLLKHVPEPYRRILEMLHDGYSPAEIAMEVELQERTIRHIIRLVASDWWHHHAAFSY